MTGDTPRERSPAEEAILEQVAERKGWDWVEEHEQHVLNQARLVGELRPKDD